MRKKMCFLSSMLLFVLSLLFVACGSTSTASGSTSISTATTTSVSTPQTADATATVQESALLQQMMLIGSPVVKINGSEYTVTGKIKNGDAQKHDIYVTATLLDATGKEVTTSTIFKVEDLDGGDTGSYTISGTDVPANTKTLTAHVSVSKVTFNY